MEEVLVKGEIHRLIPTPQIARMEEETTIEEVASMKKIHRA